MILLLSPMAPRCGILPSPPMSLCVSTISTFFQDAHVDTWGDRDTRVGEKERGELSRLKYAARTTNIDLFFLYFVVVLSREILVEAIIFQNLQKLEIRWDIFYR